MNWKRLPVLISAAVLAGVLCIGAAEAVTIDVDAPYEGEYLLIYNRNINTTSAYGTGTLPEAPASLFADLDDEARPYDVLAVETDEDGQEYIQIEPRDLDSVTPPTSSATRKKAPQRRGSEPEYGDERNFFCIDNRTKEAYDETFVLLYAGESCNVWLSKNETSRVTEDMVTELGMEYDVRIHHQVTQAFGEAYDRNGDGKMAILIYDIQDGYGSGSVGYVGGFFFKKDLTESTFNNMDVLHIDSYPTMRDGLYRAKTTMVHELQHLIEESYCIEAGCDELPLWLNEGLSTAAEHMFYGPRKDLIEYYNTVETETELTGSLFDWSRGSGGGLADYAHAYLFLQYLRTLTKDFEGGGEKLYSQFIHSKDRTTNCLLDGMRQFYPHISMNDLVRNYYIARILNEEEGLFGFAGEDAFADLKPRFHTKTNSVFLFSGAGIVRKLKPGTSFTPSWSSDSNRCVVAFSSGGPKLQPPDTNIPSGTVFLRSYVELTSCEAQVRIYYTMDGSEPTEGSTPYDGKPICLLHDTTLKAIAINDKGEKSPVVERTYTIAEEKQEIYRRIVGGQSEVGAYDTAISQDKNSVVVVGTTKAGTLGTKDFASASVKQEGKDLSDSNSLKHTNWVGYIAKYRLDGELEWMQVFDSDASCGFHQVASVKDGYVAAGFSARNSVFGKHTGDLEGFPVDDGTDSYCWILVKYDEDGNCVWTKTVPFAGGNDSSAFPYGIKAVEGGFLVAGNAHFAYSALYHGMEITYTEGLYDSVGVVARFDDDGNLLWKKELSADGATHLRDVCLLTDGNIAAVGYASKEAFGAGDLAGLAKQPLGDTIIPGTTAKSETVPIVVILDPDGNLLHTALYNKTGGKYTHFCAALSLPDGRFAAVGAVDDNYHSYYNTNHYTYGVATRGLVACYDASAVLQWDDRTMDEKWPNGYYTLHYCTDVAEAEDGFMVVLDYHLSSPGNRNFLAPLDGLKGVSSKDAVVVKYNYEGNLVWKQNIYSTCPSPNKINETCTEPYSLTYIGGRTYVAAGQASSPVGTSKVRSPFFLTFLDESTNIYDIQGNVGVAGAAIGGTISGADGGFHIRVAEGESVTLEPVLEGYTFEPATLSLENVMESKSDIIFTPTEIQYTLRGTVRDIDGNPVPGVTMGDVTTGADGSYVIKVRRGAAIRLTPRLEGRVFEPGFRAFEKVTQDINDLDFRMCKRQYTVSGQVIWNEGGLGGVEVGGMTTGFDGTYSVIVEEGTALTLKPKFRSYGFEPAEITLSDVTADMPNQDFTMTFEKPEPEPAVISVAPKSVNFGTAKESYTPVGAATVTVSNSGGSESGKLRVELAEGSSFVLDTSALSETLAAAGSTTFTIKPKEGLAVGSYSETITVTDGENTLNIAVTFEVTAEDKPDPDKPDPDKPDPDNPDPDKPNPDKPDPDKPDPDKPDPEKPDPDKPDDPGDDNNGDDDSGDDEPSGGSSGGGGSLSSPAKPSTPAKPTPPPSQDKPAQTIDHTPYVYGYDNGAFLPEANLTRGQCAAILSRLMGGFEPKQSYGKLPFPDVREDAWYYAHIGYMTSQGLIKGYPDGTFRPDEPITRAEFSTLVRNVLRLENSSECDFPDVQSHWAVNPIGQLTQAGILDGYPDGTFRPDQHISRAEAVKVLNGAYHRSPDQSVLSGLDVPFTDLYPTHWAYYEILEAAMDHQHIVK